MKKWVILFVIITFLFSGAVVAFSEPQETQEQEAMPQERLMQNILELDQKLQEALKNQQQEAVILLNNQLNEAKENYELYLQEQKAKENFEGFGWGAGTSMMFMLSDEELIDEAIVDENGIVRITREGTIVPSIMLESHYFFVLNADGGGNIGVGPFVGILTNPAGDLLDALALGGMIGLRRLGEANDNSLNFGFGYVWNRNSKVLGDGIYANQPLPQGESEIRYKYKTLGGLIIMISFAF
jgi:hypothetical protein